MPRFLTITITLALLGWFVPLSVAAEPSITALAFSPDGESVILGSQGGVEVRRWPGLQHQRSLDISLRNVHDVAFSPDGSRLAIAGGAPAEEGRVHVLSWPSGEEVFAAAAHEDVVYAIAWSSDSSRLASAGLDRKVVVWGADKGEQLRQFAGHSRGVTALCFLPDSSTVVSSGIDQSLRVWNSDDGELIRTLHNHTAPVHELAVRPEGGGLPMVVSIGDDRTVRFWQPSIGRLVRFVRMDAVPLCVAWLPGEARVVVGTDDGQVHWIDADLAEVQRTFPAIDGWINSLAVHPQDGTVLVGGTAGQLMRLSTPRTGND